VETNLNASTFKALKKVIQAPKLFLKSSLLPKVKKES